MAGFSIDAALKSGFRLARREWKAVVVWGFAASVLGVLIQLISIGPVLPAYLREVGQDPKAAAAMLEQATEANALVTVPIILLLGLAVTAGFYGAICRAMLRPDERSFFFVRAGRRELWLLLTSLAIAVLAVVPLFLVILAISIVVGLLAGITGVPAILWGLLLGVPGFAGVAYLGARFSLAWVQAWDEQRFVLLDSWRLTRGQGWRILLTLLALGFLLLIIAVVVIIPTAIIAGIILGVAGMTGGAGAVVVMIVMGLAALVFFSALYGVFYTAVAAPYVEIYRTLRGASTSEAAEVFA